MAATASLLISNWAGSTIRLSARRWRPWKKPVIRSCASDSRTLWHIGQEFFRWEIATAVAGAIIGINPFNQPDVEASKDKTRALTDDYEKSHQSAGAKSRYFAKMDLLSMPTRATPPR